MESKKQNKLKNKNRPISAETDGCQRDEDRDMGKIGEGEWEIQASSTGMKSHGTKRHSVQNTVNGMVIAIFGDR